MAYLPQSFINPQQYLSPTGGGAAGLSQLYGEEAERLKSPVRETVGPGMYRTTAGPGISELQSPFGKREFLQGLEGTQITAGERALNQLLLGGQYPQQLAQEAQPIPLDVIPPLVGDKAAITERLYPDPAARVATTERLYGYKPGGTTRAPVTAPVPYSPPEYIREPFKFPPPVSGPSF